jgi:uncharacterized protein
MSMKLIETISRELKTSVVHAGNVVTLLEQGASVPFIARYRKEMTGSMDEVKITGIRDAMARYQALADRKSAIKKSLFERALLTGALEKAVDSAQSLSELEDFYEKYRPKKKTRATMAKERGLEGLASTLLSQTDIDPDAEAQKYVNAQKQVKTASDALAGARDIIAEAVNEDAAVRKAVRKLFADTAVIRSTVKKSKLEEGVKYKDYYDWQEPAFKAPSHRILAMLRGKREEVLTVRVLPDEQRACRLIENRYVKNRSQAAGHVREAITDGYRRLLSKSIETECVNQIKEQADIKAVGVFAENLKALLLSAPLGPKSVLAIDPGFRTGCKVVCLGSQGMLLDHDVIFPHGKDTSRAEKTILTLVNRYGIQAIAVGNGTAGRETYDFIQKIRFKNPVIVVMVDESGASIYSASEIARREFPDHDITVRGAVSIGRRLMDPLAELVKLDPKSIGVGQYQHDVDPALLKQTLDDGVIFCVNHVGVSVNTASIELLSRVAGLTATTAKNIVAFREENGPFKNRKALLKVPRLGPKAFEQAAGFLRIQGGAMPLDNSGVHPESYFVVEQMAEDAQLPVAALIRNEKAVAGIDLTRYVTDTVGMPTLVDIKKELLNPGRDPRDAFDNISFDDSVHEMSDLSPGMTLNGVVTNVTAFGAFVDIGVHQDGLVHISQLADRFVKDPNEVVTVRQHVKVRVLEVDIKRKRISLSMRKA